MGTYTALLELASTNATRFSDEEIVARVRAGETALYEVLMRRYNQRLFRITRGILRDDDEAEDVLQEAYVKAFASLHQFAGRARFSTWLARIAIHEAFSRLRKRKDLQETVNSPDHDRQIVESAKSSEPDPEQEALRRQTVALLERAVDALPELYRCVFMLREIEQMSTGETAACLNLTEETVKIRLLRARQMLRNELYRRAGATGPEAFQFMGARCDRVVRRVLQNLPGASVSALSPT